MASPVGPPRERRALSTQRRGPLGHCHRGVPRPRGHIGGSHFRGLGVCHRRTRLPAPWVSTASPGDCRRVFPTGTAYHVATGHHHVRGPTGIVAGRRGASPARRRRGHRRPSLPGSTPGAPPSWRTATDGARRHAWSGRRGADPAGGTRAATPGPGLPHLSETRRGISWVPRVASTSPRWPGPGQRYSSSCTHQQTCHSTKPFRPPRHSHRWETPTRWS